MIAFRIEFFARIDKMEVMTPDAIKLEFMMVDSWLKEIGEKIESPSSIAERIKKPSSSKANRGKRKRNSDRESKVVELLKKGLTEKAIMKELGYGKKLVKDVTREFNTPKEEPAEEPRETVNYNTGEKYDEDNKLIDKEYEELLALKLSDYEHLFADHKFYKLNDNSKFKLDGDYKDMPMCAVPAIHLFRFIKSFNKAGNVVDYILDNWDILVIRMKSEQLDKVLSI